MSLQSAAISCGVNLEEQISDTLVNYWMIVTIIITLACFGLLICIITVLILLKTRKGKLSTSTGLVLNTIMQQRRMDEDSSTKVDDNKRDGLHPRRHTEMLESMYTNDIYVERNQIDAGYTSLELQDYNHVYAFPSFRNSGNKN